MPLDKYGTKLASLAARPGAASMESSTDGVFPKFLKWVVRVRSWVSPKKNYSMLRSILGSPYLGKLPLRPSHSCSELRKRPGSCPSFARRMSVPRFERVVGSDRNNSKSGQSYHSNIGY